MNFAEEQTARRRLAGSSRAAERLALSLAEDSSVDEAAIEVVRRVRLLRRVAVSSGRESTMEAAQRRVDLVVARLRAARTIGVTSIELFTDVLTVIGPPLDTQSQLSPYLRMHEAARGVMAELVTRVAGGGSRDPAVNDLHRLQAARWSVPFHDDDAIVDAMKSFDAQLLRLRAEPPPPQPGDS